MNCWISSREARSSTLDKSWSSRKEIWRHNWVRISIHKVLDVHTVGAKCKFSYTYTIHYIDKVFLSLGKHYESRKRKQDMISKQGSNVKSQNNVGKQETQDVVESMQRRERRIVRMGDDVVCGWMDAKNICKTKSPRGRINRLDVCESWCEAKDQKMGMKMQMQKC